MSPTSLIHPSSWVPVGVAGLEPEALRATRATTNTLVTAGPGAGKTELLGQRGVYLLQTGLCPHPRRLLAISFKRDAAKNLRERFQRRCAREQAGRLDSMTFDAFAKQILDRFWRALPNPWTFNQSYLVGQQMERRGYGDFQRACADTLTNPARPAGWAGSLFGRSPTQAEVYGVGIDEFKLGIHALRLAPLTIPTVAAFLQLVALRDAYTKAAVSLTFPMISRLAQLIIDTNPQIRAALLATYSHLFMDEFQDTTGTQYGLMHSIFGNSHTVITAVGDDKQKIMGWAGAQENGFDTFKGDFLATLGLADTQPITLSVNYRSNRRIVEVLNILKSRLAPNEPDFRATRDAPALEPHQICSVIVCDDANAEGQALAAFLVKELKSGLPPREIGLLVRQKARDWEETLNPVLAGHGIALRNEDRDLGGASIQDLMAEPYATAIIDGIELLTLKRGGAVWTKVLNTFMEMEGYTTEEEAPRIRLLADRLNTFHEEHNVASSKAAPDEQKAIELIELVEQMYGIEQLRASAPNYGQGDFFKRIRQATRTFFTECAQASPSWTDSLSRYRGTGQVPLMTITKSKGLEYNIVVLLGLDDDQWWSFKNNPNEGHSTFFVAASRARERLFMTFRQTQNNAKIREIYDLLQTAGVGAVGCRDWVSS